MILLTHENLHKGQTGNGGFNYAQLAALGVATPPRKGWLRRLIGTQVSAESYELFLSLKGATQCVKKRDSELSPLAGYQLPQTEEKRQQSPATTVQMAVPIELVETVQGLIRLRESLVRK
jgi:hypothetical protein